MDIILGGESMFMSELINEQDNVVGLKQVKIKGMRKVEEYVFVVFDNGQKILTDGNNLYDVSQYRSVVQTFNMGGRTCAVLINGFSPCVVDLKTMEVLYEDRNADYVSKKDDRMLHIIMKTGGGNTTLYDIETMKYLPAPDDYKFECALGNNLYVFREARDLDTDFYAYKRCVIDADGRVLLKDIDGWIELNGNHLIITRTDDICVVGINEDLALEMKIIKQNESILAKPYCYEGNIIIIEKGVIKLYTPALELISEIKVDGLEEIVDYEVVDDTLKLCLPLTVEGRIINRHLFVNLKTGKYIAHTRIEGYPYWTPTIFVGQDNLDSEVREYYFYNVNYEPIIKVTASSCESVDISEECIFLIRTNTGDGEKRQLLNAKTGKVRDIDYVFVRFDMLLPYGYGVNPTDGTIDFFDGNLNTVISGFDYKKYDLSFSRFGFGFLVVNDYVCVINSFVDGPDGYGQSRARYIIQNCEGEVVLDSTEYECHAIGNLIQIIGSDGTKYLNTLTGEIGSLSLEASLDEDGNINFNEIEVVNNLLAVGNNIQSLFSPDDTSEPKVKKLYPNEKKDG